jgi:hypothetical protein
MEKNIIYLKGTKNEEISFAEPKGLSVDAGMKCRFIPDSFSGENANEVLCLARMVS